MAGTAVDHGRYIRILQTFLCYIQSQMLCVEGFQIRQDFLPQRQGKGLKFCYVLMGKGCP